MDEQEKSQPWHQSPVRGDHMERRLGMENMSRRQEDLPRHPKSRGGEMEA